MAKAPAVMSVAALSLAVGIAANTISNWGFSGNDDEVVEKAIDSMGGVSLVLAGLKAFLEHGIALNLVADHHPDAHREQSA